MRIADYEDYLHALSDEGLLEELWGDTARGNNLEWFAIQKELKARGLLRAVKKVEDNGDPNNNDWEMREEAEAMARNCQEYETHRYQSASGDYS